MQTLITRSAIQRFINMPGRSHTRQPCRVRFLYAEEGTKSQKRTEL
jgi:hypothetical protein